VRRHLPPWPLVLISGLALADPRPQQFDWPDGLSCRVEHRELQPDGTETVVAFRVDAKPAPEGGKYVVPSNAHWIAPDRPGDEAAVAQARLLLSRLPPFHVGPAGTLRGLQDAARARQEMRLALAAAEPKPTGAELDAAVDFMGSEQGLLNHVSEFWNAAVEQWLDVRFDTQPVISKTTVQVDQSEDPLQVDVKLTRSEPRSCRRGGREHQCVELVYEEIPEPASLEHVMSGIVGSMGGNGEVRALAMKTVIVTVTEPDTLIPQSVTSSRRLEFGPPGTKSPTVMNQRQSWSFTCDEATAR
jgi:hypothetical protein